MKTRTLQRLGAAGAVTVFSVSLVSGQTPVDQNRPARTIDQPASPTYQRDTTLNQSDRITTAGDFQARNLFKGKEIVGMDIKNQQSEDLGEVKELIVNLPEGRVLYAIVSSGGLFGGKLAAVPPSALSRSADEKHLILNMASDKFKSAPTFESGSWPDMSNRTWSKEVYGYYGATPYWDSSTVTIPSPTPDTRSATERLLDSSRDKAVAHDTTREQLKGMSKFHKASELFGMKVENPQDEKLGDINDLVIDLPAGRIVYAVLASGGFLGLGEKFLAIPPSSFAFDASDKNLVLSVDKERLKAAPGFDKDQWPSMADQSWHRQVYSYYGQSPYWDSGTSTTISEREVVTTDVDNTRRNVRDREGDTLTPADQGTSEIDRQLTAQIRRSITEEDSFSTNAKNIKIVTVNGAVTLRGVVNSQTEKDLLEARAKQVAGVARVDNQLEVNQQ